MTGDLGEYWRDILRRAFRMNVVAPGDRNEVIARAQNIVGKRLGDILDFKMFSNVSLNLNVSISADGLLRVADDMRAAGWRVEHTPDAPTLAAGDSRKIDGTIQITFPTADGELKNIIPAVPG